jgi:hypothetical protein
MFKLPSFVHVSAQIHFYTFYTSYLYTVKILSSSYIEPNVNNVCVNRYIDFPSNFAD